MAYVYAIKCIATEFVYIGCSRARKGRRWNEHMSLLRRGKHTAAKMLEDWREFGRSSFVMLTLEELGEATLEQRRTAELRWLHRFQSTGRLYNAAIISFGPGPRSAIMTGTPEAREKRSKALKGKPKHPGHGAKISATKKALGQRPSLEVARMGGKAAAAKRYGRNTDEIVCSAPKPEGAEVGDKEPRR